jgi:hypothetical protein
LLLLLIEAPKVTAAATEGIRLCLESLIPSLFPFLFVITVLNSYLITTNNPFLTLLGKVTGMPAGSESIFLLGILGGYPTGAQCIGRSYQKGMLTKKDAAHMIVFCNNAGPAFIIGVGTFLFENDIALLALWGLQGISALIVGYLTRIKSVHTCVVAPQSQSIHEALLHSVKVMGIICGWVIVFRILITFLDFLPTNIQIGISGILELSNGFYALNNIKNSGIRFIAAAIILAWGGLCVLMQTAGLIGDIGIGRYLKGKLLQTLLILPLSYFTQLLLFTGDEQAKLHWSIAIFPLIVIILHYSIKIVLAFRKNLVYNGEKVQSTE